MEDSEVSAKGKPKHNILALVLGIIAFCLLIATVVLILIVLQEKHKDEDSVVVPDRRVLRDEPHVREAGRMMHWMNVSVDPCDDFYEYACGSYVKFTPMPDGQVVWNFGARLTQRLWDDLKPLVSATVKSNDLESIKKVKWTYEACMNEGEIERLGPQPLLDLLNSLGGWPVLDPNWNEGTLDLVQLMADLALMGYDSIVKFTVAANLTDSSKSTIRMSAPEIALASQLMGSDVTDVAVVDQYQALAFRIAKMLDANARVPEQHIFDSIVEIVDFEKELAKLIKSVSGHPDFISVADLMGMPFPQTSRSWSELIGAYMTGGGSTYDPDQVILVITPAYMANVTSMLQNVNIKTIVNWLLWNAVSSLSAQLSPDFETESRNILALSQPVITNEPRWSKCVQLANKYMKRATGRMYVDACFDDATKQDVTTMGQDLRKAFEAIIHKATWMDLATRNLAEEKLAAMPIMVGYSEQIMNNTILQEDYGAFGITTTHHFVNIVNLRKNDVALPIKNFAKGQDRDQWYGSVAEVNAAHVLAKNHVEINAAILHPIAYSHKYPKYANYGAIGVFLGHEMTHGFDNDGRSYDKDGNYNEWWSGPSSEAFVNRSQCLINQYSGFTFPDYGLTVNGSLTLPENIADNGGMKESFMAYTSWKDRNGKEPALPGFEHFSNDQMFFLAWGQLWCELNTEAYLKHKIETDNHSPAKFRVIGPLQNSPHFATTYNCPVGSYMNPAQKCSVW